MLLVFTLPIDAQSPNAVFPKAQVTFYSGGRDIFGKPKSKGAFFGKIFDGDHLLASQQRHRFVTFTFEPGIHVLSSNVWMSRSPEGGSHLTINLLTGHHYFVNTAFEATNWFGGMRLLIQEMDCQDAQVLGAETKPLETKHLKSDGLVNVVNENLFPSCP